MDFRWVIRFLMTGAAIFASILLGCFWMPHPVRSNVSGYGELKEFWTSILWVSDPPVAHASMCCVRCWRHILPLLRCQRPSEFQELPALSRYVFGIFWPNMSRVAFIWLPKQVMQTPKCIDFCFMFVGSRGL